MSRRSFLALSSLAGLLLLASSTDACWRARRCQRVYYSPPRTYCYPAPQVYYYPSRPIYYYPCQPAVVVNPGGSTNPGSGPGPGGGGSVDPLDQLLGALPKPPKPLPKIPSFLDEDRP
jgi:hypothetical protein